MTCYKCNKEINKLDHYVNLDTFKDNKLIHHVSFHMKCWGEYNTERVNQRILELANVGENILKQTGIMA